MADNVMEPYLSSKSNFDEVFKYLTTKHNIGVFSTFDLPGVTKENSSDLNNFSFFMPKEILPELNSAGGKIPIRVKGNNGEIETFLTPGNFNNLLVLTNRGVVSAGLNSSREEVMAHELGHSLFSEVYGAAFLSPDIEEKVRQISNWKYLEETSVRFRGKFFNQNILDSFNNPENIRKIFKDDPKIIDKLFNIKYLSGADEVIADSFASVILGEEPPSILSPLLGVFGKDTNFLGFSNSPISQYLLKTKNNHPSLSHDFYGKINQFLEKNKLLFDEIEGPLSSLGAASNSTMSSPPSSSGGGAGNGGGGDGPKKGKQPKRPNQPRKQQQQSQPFKYESIFETIPYAKGKLDYIQGTNFGEYAGERQIKDTIIPFLQSKDMFRNGPDTSIMATEKGRRYKTLYEQAFSKRQFFFDLETTGDAQKTDKAKVYQATLYHYDPAVAGDQVKHYVTDNLHVLQELSKNRGLKPGEALTYYFNLGDEPKERILEFGEVHLPGMGKKEVSTYGPDEVKRFKQLRQAVYRGGTEQQAIKEEGQAFKAIFGIFDKAWENDPGGAILNVHNSNFDFTQIQLAGLRGRQFKTGEMMMSYFGEGLTPKSTMKMYQDWLKKNKKKLSKADRAAFYDRTKNKNLYRPFAEGNVRTENATREFTHAARIARRTKDVFERRRELARGAKIVEDGTTIALEKYKGFFEEHLQAMIRHVSTPGAKLSATDSMNLLKASHLLQQKYGYAEKRGNIALGTSLDLLSIAKSGMPITHLESTDITKYGDIVKNEYENIILPLLANGKLNPEGKRQVYIRERLAKIDNEKNIAESIFQKYQEAISRQKIKVTGELGTKVEQKARIKVSDLEGFIEESIQYYTQPQTIRSSRILDKPIRESLEAEHGKDTADIIQRYIEKIDKEYQKKYYHDMSVMEQITEDGDIKFRKRGYGSGEFQTMDYDEMSKLISEMSYDTKTTFDTLHSIEGADLTRRSNAMVKANLDPTKAGKVIDLFDQFRPAFIPITQQVEELRKKADQVQNFDKSLKMKIFGWTEVVNGQQIVHPPKKPLIDFLKRKQTNARTKLVVGAVIGLGAIAAYNRTEKMMAEDADQKDYQARFDYYLSETGASINADGSGDYEVDVLSVEDRESYSGFDSLNIYERVLKTDFESPFKAPIVSAPLAKEKMSNNVKKMSSNQVNVGYNKCVDHNMLADLNRQAQVANHRRLQGKYNMLQTDYNLDG